MIKIKENGSWKDVAKAVDLTTKQDKSALVTTIDSTSTNATYPGTKAVYDYITPNPTLSGTEENLTGLQVGTKKYKVPSGTHLYLHTIYCSVNSTIIQDTNYFNVNIYSTSSEEVTSNTTMINLLKTIGNKIYCNQGWLTFSGSNKAIGMLYTNGSTTLTVQYHSNGIQTYDLINSATAGNKYTDVVTQIF